jgi:hypothetical protein
MKKKRTRKSVIFLGGAAFAFAAFFVLGTIPELVRYMRIRRM